MKTLRTVCLMLTAFGAVSYGQVDIGSGAPDATIASQFQGAFFRNGFSALVTLPPQANVTTYGSTGLIQRFTSSTSGGGTLALVKADRSDANINVYQVYAAMYSYYNSVGATTAGYPTTDTLTCPASANVCQYQLFNKNYALFTYSAASLNGTNFAIADPYYTKWANAGGVLSIGPANSAATSVKSSVSAITATVQTYSAGAIFNITSGTLAGRLVLVSEPAWDLYLANNAGGGFLGYPTADAVGSSNGQQTQTFEGGTVQWTAGQGASILLAVAGVSISPSYGPFYIKLRDTITLQAYGYDRGGNQLAGRTIAWSTSNADVISIQASGGTAVLTGAGGGTASITASTGGKVSPAVIIYVTAPCCQIGQGAPNATIQQAFQDVVTRDGLKFQLPAAAPVERSGQGYVQAFLSVSNPPAQYVLAKSDSILQAYYLTGDILTAYTASGGTTGPFGYPISDPTPGGRQMFENGALAGKPVQMVADPILDKWAALSYETGSAGSPAGAFAAFLSFGGSSGVMQAFTNGKIYAATAGPQANKSFFVGGVIAAAYDAGGSVSGPLGMPLSDEYTAATGKRHQDFEGGYMEYVPGSSQAQTVANPRRPAMGATPGTVTPGTRVRLTISGFNAGASLRVSVSGQPDFIVATQSGWYTWEMYVPISAAAGPVQVKVVDTQGTDSAQGSYAVQPLGTAGLQVAKLAGDNQSGAPGAQLAQPLQIVLQDGAGNAIIGAPVQFSASPGATITPTAAITDQNGQAQATLVLPMTTGVVLANVASQGKYATFSAIAAPAALGNFPVLSQSLPDPLGNGTNTIAQDGAMLTTVAAILRYHQNRGELPSLSGSADPSVLNLFLKNLCVLSAQGGPICDGFLHAPQSGQQIVNLWRVGSFVGGAIDVSVENADVNTVRNLVAGGAPVLVALSLSSGGAPAGSNFVVATGVSSDGGVQIFDPNPAFGRTALNDYLQGFTAGSKNWKGTLAAAARLVLRAPKTKGFLVASGAASFELTSAAGVCGANLDLPDGAGVFRMRYCDGSQSAYQLDVLQSGPSTVTLTDVGNPGSLTTLSNTGPASYKVSQPIAQWTAVPQTTAFTGASVVNAASFTSAIAPGGLISVFGAGLSRTGAATTADIRGVPLKILAATPFQLNAQVPFELVAGTYPLRIHSPYGDNQQLVTIQDTAPAIFLMGPQQAAIANQDGTLNTPTQPISRGQVIVIYGTGLGAVSQSGNFSVAQQAVTALIQGIQAPVAFAGLTPGFIGLYQVNLQIPASIPPGLGATLALQQGSNLSNSVTVAIQ